MKRIVKLTLVVVFIVVLLAVAFPGSAQTVRTDFTQVEYDCLTDPGVQWQQGNVMHIRDILHTNFGASDNPLWTGVNTTVANADINLSNGIAAIRGTASFQPAGIDGTWEMTWNWIYGPGQGVGFGSAVGHGTGGLEGKTVFLKLYDLPYDPVIEQVCEGTGTPEGIIFTEGYILDPGGS